MEPVLAELGLNVDLEQQVLSPCTKRQPANGFGRMESLSSLILFLFSPIHPLPLGCVWLPGHDLWFHLPFLLLCKAKLKIDEQGGLRGGALKERKGLLV